MAACHTKANNKKNTGITGSISTKGRNKIYASGNLVKNIIKICYFKFFDVDYLIVLFIEFNHFISFF